MKFRILVYLFLWFILFSCNHSIKQKEILDHTSFHHNVVSEPLSFDLDSIKARGVLRAIVVGGPTSYFLYKGEPMGFEYELLKSFTKELGVDLEIIVAKNFNELGEWLNTGKGDLIAYGMTVTLERQKKFSFSEYLYLTKQVLVQRKPKNWRKMKTHEIDRELKHDVIQLINDTISVRNNSSYKMRLENLMNEIGGKIHIDTVSSQFSTDELIGMVNSGQIKYTIAENVLAEMHAYHFNDLHVFTPVSFSQRASWAMRKNAPKLTKQLNNWIAKMKKHADYFVIYNKYYKNRSDIVQRIESDYYINTTGKLSPYDDLIKKYAEDLPWDWELLASQVFQESNFDPNARSWASAHGLMQIMPSTARELGIHDTSDPEQSLKGGTFYLLFLWKQWGHISDENERIKFTLASYNAGLGHIQDAIKLTELSGGNTNLWGGHVEQSLLNLTYQKYYAKPQIRHGYVHGIEPVNYVKEIFDRYNMYKSFLDKN